MKELLVSSLSIQTNLIIAIMFALFCLLSVRYIISANKSQKENIADSILAINKKRILALALISLTITVFFLYLWHTKIEIKTWTFLPIGCFLLFTFTTLRNATNYLLTRKNRVGYVFLSWTLHHPRDNAVMSEVIKALDWMNIEHYNYTKYQVDDSIDNREEIGNLLETAIKKCDVSIEIISSDILFHEWVQHERNLLRKHNKLRYFICLERQFLLLKGKNEHLIKRLDFSDSYFGGNTAMASTKYSDTTSYKTKTFRLKCLKLASEVRNSLLTNKK